MASTLDPALDELVLANRILWNEGIFDVFDQVSMRHPSRSDRFFMAARKAPVLFNRQDLVEFDVEGQPAGTTGLPADDESLIHREIYKARADVMAVCHHRFAGMLPYCNGVMKLIPVYHLGSVIGQEVPVVNGFALPDDGPDLGDDHRRAAVAITRALGLNVMVLTQHDGAAIVVGASVSAVVFRTIFGCRNAEYQTQANRVGNIEGLTPGEIALAKAFHEQQPPITRAWEMWSARAAGMKK